MIRPDLTRRLRIIAVLGGTLLFAAGCAGSYGPKQAGGGLLGAGLGALAGSQIGGGTGQLVAIGAGTLLGALVGSEVGVSLDRADRLYANQSVYQGLNTVPSGNTVGWNNPDSGNYGTFTPQSTYQTSAGAYCREYQQTITVGGRLERSYGTACRQPDGSWSVDH